VSINKNISTPLLNKDVDPTVAKAIRDIYDTINKLSDSVNQSGNETSSYASGDPGDLRAVQEKNSSRGIYKLQVRTEQGWSDFYSPGMEADITSYLSDMMVDGSTDGMPEVETALTAVISALQCLNGLDPEKSKLLKIITRVGKRAGS